MESGSSDKTESVLPASANRVSLLCCAALRSVVRLLKSSRKNLSSVSSY